MTNVTDALSSSPPLGNVLDAGVDFLSRQQVIQFREYRRIVLPADKYLFWVSSGRVVDVIGSLHYSSDLDQASDQTIGINRLIFATKTEIEAFNKLSPDSMFIGNYRGIKIAFSGRRQRAPEANIWHYFGNAIYPPFFSQIIDDPATIEDIEPIVSNSLPIWLALTAFAPVFPAYLVEENLPPPYVVVDIDADTTEVIQSLPDYSAGYTTQGSAGLYTVTATQLVRERVKFIAYGMNNVQAISYRSYLLENSVAGDVWGVMSVTPIRDDRRTQTEIAALAMKKTFEIEVNYLQSAVTSIAERLITSASINFST